MGIKRNSKKVHREKLLDYLSNPENPPLTRAALTSKVLGLKNRTALYSVFTIDELTDIEDTALALRRKRCSRMSFQVDNALFKKAARGDVKAATLYYKRIEGWSEKTTVAVEHNLDQLRDYAIQQGHDPDEFIATYLSIKAGNRDKD